MTNLNIAQSQVSNIPKNVVPITLTIPSQSAFSWGSTSIINLQTKKIKVHELLLDFNLGAMSGVVADSSGGFPYLNPATSFVPKVEIITDNVVQDTLNGDFNHILNQIFSSDIDRALQNYATGPYTNKTELYNKTVTGDHWYVNLKCLFNQTNLALLNSHHDVQLRVTMPPLLNVINAGPSLVASNIVIPINNVSLLVRCTQLDDATNQRLLVESSKIPRHSLYLSNKYLPFVINSGVSNSTSIITFTGMIHSIYFILRPTNALTGINQFQYSNKVKDFSILSNAGENITGGVVIPMKWNMLEQQKWWLDSTFPLEAYNGVNPSYMGMYSWSVSPNESFATGRQYGSRWYSGQEQLLINYVSPLSSAHQLDVFALCESAVESSPMFMRKIDIMKSYN